MSHYRLLPFVMGASVVCAGILYLARKKPKSPEQREAERRQRINSTGRITDGTVLDVREFQQNNYPAQVLIYTYDVGGVSYEAAQDITKLRQFVDLHTCRIGLPTSVKYDPHHPGDSIVICEGWIGLRQ